MISARFLSVTLLAIATLTTSPAAQATSVEVRHAARLETASGPLSGLGIHSKAYSSSSHVGISDAHEQRGNVCDHGDNPMIC